MWDHDITLSVFNMAISASGIVVVDYDMTLLGFNMAMSVSSIVVVAYNIPLLGASIVVVKASIGDVRPWHGAAAGGSMRWRRI